jgi:DnaD/phage-associated family protein
VTFMAGEVNKGWISLYRSIQDHWLWQEKPFSKAQAWLDLLLSANHQDKKIVFDSNLVEVKRGEFITSIRKLCERWGWSNSKVKKFLETLQLDGMITYKSDTKKTTINIVNYNVYQQSSDAENVTETSQKHHRNVAETSQKHTNNNDNNDNNVNNDNNKTTTTICGSDEEFNIYKFLEKCNFILSPMLLEKIQADIEIYSLEEVKKAIEIADSNGKHSYSYVKGILERRRAGENKKITDRELFEKAAKEFLEDE